MLKRIKALLLGNLFLIAIGITLFIGYLSLMKMPQLKIEVKNLDKGYHLIAYFTLAVSWLCAFYKKPKKTYLIVTLCIVYGILIEILQDKLTVYRTGDYRDIIANSIGVLLGLFLFNLIFKKIIIKWQ